MINEPAFYLFGLALILVGIFIGCMGTLAWLHFSEKDQ